MKNKEQTARASTLFLVSPLLRFAPEREKQGQQRLPTLTLVTAWGFKQRRWEREKHQRSALGEKRLRRLKCVSSENLLETPLTNLRMMSNEPGAALCPQSSIRAAPLNLAEMRP